MTNNQKKYYQIIDYTEGSNSIINNINLEDLSVNNFIDYNNHNIIVYEIIDIFFSYRKKKIVLMHI